MTSEKTILILKIQNIEAVKRLLRKVTPKCGLPISVRWLLIGLVVKQLSQLSQSFVCKRANYQHREQYSKAIFAEAKRARF